MTRATGNERARSFVRRRTTREADVDFLLLCCVNEFFRGKKEKRRETQNGDLLYRISKDHFHVLDTAVCRFIFGFRTDQWDRAPGASLPTNSCFIYFEDLSIGTARPSRAFSTQAPVTPSRVHLATRASRVEGSASPQAALSSQARDASPLVRSNARAPRRAGTQSFARPNPPGASTAVVCRRWQPRPRPRARTRPRPASRARAASARPRRSARR